MSSSQEALDYAHFVVDAALRAGATQAEATVSINDRFSTEARGRAITKLEQSTGRLLHARVFVDGRKASLATSDFERGSLEDAVSTVVSQARHVAFDPYAMLPDAARVNGRCDLNLFAHDVAKRDAQVKIDEALELEERIRAIDSRISNSNGAHVGDTVSTIALVNSNRFAGDYQSTRVHRSVSPVALDGENKRTGAYGTAGRRLRDMEDAASVARKAVERTVGLFGARKPPTMRVPVIFERDVAASVLADLFSALSASNVAIGNSWLAERMGSRIGSDLVTIVDDGTLRGLLGTSPFDGEGVPTQRTAVFERGTLRSFLYDTYYARKLGAQSTGNGSGGGVAPNNFYLEAGSRSLEQARLRNLARHSGDGHDRFCDGARERNVQPRRARILHRKRRDRVSRRGIHDCGHVPRHARRNRRRGGRFALRCRSRVTVVSRGGNDRQRRLRKNVYLRRPRGAFVLAVQVCAMRILGAPAEPGGAESRT